MPRAKRPLADSDPNSQPAPKRPAKNAKASSASTSDASKTRTDIKTKFLQTPFDGKYEYVCFDPPSWANEDDGESDEEEEDSGDESNENNGKDKMFNKPAKDHSGHKYIFMKATLELLSDNCRETTQRDPDNFDMYVYNDFLNYAVLDLVEELVGLKSSVNNAEQQNQKHKANKIHCSANSSPPPSPRTKPTKPGRPAPALPSSSNMAPTADAGCTPTMATA